jgi:hypothetical protein
MFALDNVVLWGRSFDEYRRMFALSEADLRRRILGCADGPASFNAELTARGGSVVSCDPVYRFAAEDIRRRVAISFELVIEQTRRNVGEFVWSHEIPDVEALGRWRMAAMERFLADFDSGRAAGRYVDAELPQLPFADRAFDIAVCSHFLFLYSERFDIGFHEQAIRELCRVADEVRVFPLLELGSVRSRHLEGVFRALRNEGFQSTIERVEYEFQRDGNEMLRISR